MNKSFGKLIDTENPTERDMQNYVDFILNAILNGNYKTRKNSYKGNVNYTMYVDMTTVFGFGNTGCIDSTKIFESIQKKSVELFPKDFTLKWDGIGADNGDGLAKTARIGEKWDSYSVNIPNPNKFTEGFRKQGAGSMQSFNESYAIHLFVKALSYYSIDSSLIYAVGRKYPDCRLDKHIKQEQFWQSLKKLVGDLKKRMSDVFKPTEKSYDY